MPIDTASQLPPSLQKSFEAILEDAGAQVGNEKEDPNIDLGLIIVDETRTRNGAEFYHSFYQQLTLDGELPSATVLVKEEPFRTRMTRLLIKVNDVDVVQTILRPNGGEQEEELIESSVARVKYYINNYAEVQESLNGDDLSGSGIH